MKSYRPPSLMFVQVTDCVIYVLNSSLLQYIYRKTFFTMTGLHFFGK